MQKHNKTTSAALALSDDCEITTKELLKTLINNRANTALNCHYASVANAIYNGGQDELLNKHFELDEMLGEQIESFIDKFLTDANESIDKRK